MLLPFFFKVTDLVLVYYNKVAFLTSLLYNYNNNNTKRVIKIMIIICFMVLH